MFVYKLADDSTTSESYRVGFYRPDGGFEIVRADLSQKEAENTVHFLNGGNMSGGVYRQLEQISEAAATIAAAAKRLTSQ